MSESSSLLNHYIYASCYTFENHKTTVIHQNFVE